MAENSLSDLITYIGTDVYGREMREHIKEAFEILARSSLTAEEKAKIAASISYEPQTLTDAQKSAARNNIGAAKAGDSGRGWTEEQIDLLESFKEFFDTMKDHIGYDENSADGTGQTAAKNAVDALASLITSLRTVPRELESVTLAVNAVAHVSGQDITKNELVVTCHYSVGPDEVITDGYTIDPAKWTHPYTNVKVTYNGVVSNSVLVPVAEPPAATISIDDASDTTHLKVAVNLGTDQITVSKGNPYFLYEADKSKNITITLSVEAAQTGKYVIDDSTEVTMTDGSFFKTGTIYTASSITGNIVIKAISKALPKRIDATYEGGTVPAGTTLAQLTGITVTATYYDENVVTLTSEKYELSVAGGGDLVTGENTVNVAGKDEYAGLTDDFNVHVEAAPTPTTKATGTYTNTGGGTVKTTGAVSLTPESGTGFTSEPNKVTVQYTGGTVPQAYNFYTLVLTRSGSAWTVDTIKNGNNASNLKAGDSATVVFGTDRSTVTISNVYSHTTEGGEVKTNGGFHAGATYSITCEVV